jgi:hypothetical protein
MGRKDDIAPLPPEPRIRRRDMIDADILFPHAMQAWSAAE